MRGGETVVVSGHRAWLHGSANFIAGSPKVWNCRVSRCSKQANPSRRCCEPLPGACPRWFLRPWMPASHGSCEAFAPLCSFASCAGAPAKRRRGPWAMGKNVGEDFLALVGCGHGSTSRTFSEHPNPHLNRVVNSPTPKWYHWF